MTELNPDEVLIVIEKAKSLGVQELEYNGIKVKFKNEEIKKPETPPLVSQVPDLDQVFKPLSPLDDVTPEEILYYATPYYAEIQAEKEAKLNKIEE